MKKLLALLTLVFLIGCNNNPGKNTNSTSRETPVRNEQKQERDSNTYFDLNNFQELVETYEDPERGEWQNPQLVIDKLGPLEGHTFADIGAGTGYFTFRIASQGGNVIAIDIDNRFLEYIEDRKAELIDAIPPDRISTRLAEENDPFLKENEVDAAMLVNTYHFLTDRPAYLRKIAQGLKPEGKIVIVDYKKEEMPVGPPAEHKVSLNGVKEEIEKAGLEILEVDSKSLNYQYIITLKKK